MAATSRPLNSTTTTRGLNWSTIALAPYVGGVRFGQLLELLKAAVIYCYYVSLAQTGPAFSFEWLQAGELLGSSVAVSGDLVVVGSPGKDVGFYMGAGAAIVYSYNNASKSLDYVSEFYGPGLGF